MIPYETYYVGDETIVTTTGSKTLSFTLREYRRVDNNQSLYILDTDTHVNDVLTESNTTEGQDFLTFPELMLAMRNIYNTFTEDKQ